MNTEYVYAKAEEFRCEARSLYARADAVLHDDTLSVVCRERLAASMKKRAGHAYDDATEMDNEARRIWRGEAA
jgi:hypothetical protein